MIFASAGAAGAAGIYPGDVILISFKYLQGSAASKVISDRVSSDYVLFEFFLDENFDPGSGPVLY